MLACILVFWRQLMWTHFAFLAMAIIAINAIDWKTQPAWLRRRAR